MDAEIKEMFGLILSKLDGMQNQMDGMQNNMDGMQNQMNNMQNQMDGMQNQMDGMQNQMDGMQNQMDGMQNQINSMQNQINSMQDKIDKNTTETPQLRCFIEEEIRPQMRIIADGHLALVEKYNEIEKVKQSRELMEIRLLTLEAEIRQLKQAI